jgi:hypothetical protein
MNNQRTGESLLAEARRHIEAGEFEEACRCCNNAHFAFIHEKNIAGVIHCYVDLVNAYQHLSKSSTDDFNARVYAQDALQTAQTARRFCQEYKDEPGVKEEFPQVQFRYGTALALNSMYKEATESLRLALVTLQRSAAQRFDWLGHLGMARLKGKLDEISGITDMRSAILRLHEAYEKSSDSEERYSLGVWFSGNLLEYADWLLEQGSEVEGRQCYEQAKQVITADERLKVRQQQLARFEEKHGLL